MLCFQIHLSYDPVNVSCMGVGLGSKLALEDGKISVGGREKTFEAGGGEKVSLPLAL